MELTEDYNYREFTVEGKTFRIGKIVVWVYKAWQEVGEAIDAATKLVVESARIKMDLASQKITPEAAAKKEEKLVEDNKKYDIYELRFKIIKVLLEKNGEVFDREWWEMNCTPHEINQFIQAVLRGEDDGKKKDREQG